MKTIIIDGVEYNLTLKELFKKGDWIINNDKRIAAPTQILKIEEYGYVTSSGYTSFDKVKTDYHLWTIEDAKDGDVLAFDWKDEWHWQKIVIFKSLNKFGVEGYGNTFKNGKLAFNEEVPYYSKTWTKTLQPATKEQRDLLFQKMKEEGYEWNAEKKELKKIEKQGEQKPIIIIPQFKVGDIIKPKPYNEEHLIKDINENGYVLDVDIIIPFKDEDVWEIVEQKPTWSEEDEQNLRFWLDNNKSIDSDKRNWLKSFKDRVQPQQKQEWNEEDERNASYICASLDCYYRLREDRNNTNGQEDLDKARNWLYNKLKSIKPNHWKPSEEQMQALFEAKLASIKNREYFLGLLYEDLKKL